MPAATVSVAWSNTPPGNRMSVLASDPGGVLAGAVFASSSGHSQITFTTPFTGRLVITGPAPGGADFEADIGADQQINDENWPTHTIAGNPPGIIPAGTVLNVRFRNDVGFVGDPGTDYFDFMRDESLANYGTNTAPTANGAPAVTFDNSSAASNGAPAVSFDNTAASASSAPAVAFSNTPADQKVLAGEQAPVAGVTTPVSTAVAHTFPLVAGTNYFVKVGSRAAPVTVNLPDPGSDCQRIEIADLTGQGATFPVTVNAGTKQIDGAGTSYLVNRAYAVLALVYADGAWKLV